MGDQRAIEPLIMLLANLSDADPQFETSLRKAIERLEPLGYLLVKLKDPEPEAREKAAKMLRIVGDPDGADALIATLKDPSPKVRETSASALARLGLAKSASALITVLNGDTDSGVRMAAAQALGYVDTPEVKRALEHAAKTEPNDFVKLMIERSLSIIADGARKQ
jgi:HEAT repeat protein